MAISTAGVYLGMSTTALTPDENGEYTNAEKKITEYDKIVDITDYPDLLSTPERIETTTLSNLKTRTYRTDLRDTEAFTFTANFDDAQFLNLTNKTAPVEGESPIYACCVLFGQSGSVIRWSAEITLGISGGGISEIVRSTVTATPSTEVYFDTENKGSYNDSTKKITLSERS